MNAPVDRIIDFLRRELSVTDNGRIRKKQLLNEYSDRLFTIAKIRAHSRNSNDISDSDFTDANQILSRHPYRFGNLILDIFIAIGSGCVGAAIRLLIEPNYEKACIFFLIGIFILAISLVVKYHHHYS
jgi:hypothetical protein